MIDTTKKTIEKLYPEIMNTVETLTKIDRGTKSLSGLAETADYLADKLRELGCEVVFHPDDTYGATVVGRKKGKGKVRILLFAHMDTIWPEGTCEQNPYRVDGRCAYGPGVSDCTHGIIASLYMLKALNEMGVDNYGEIIILFNPDEELTSPSSTKWIEHYAKGVDIAFCMEGPDGEDLFISSRGGSAYYEIRVKGKMAHAGVEPEKGRNAIHELVYKLDEIQKHPVDGAYFCVCWINGGNGDCIVADNAYAMIRYRIYSYDTIDKINEVLNKINEKPYVEGTETTITYWKEGGFGPLVRKEWVDKFCRLFEKTSAELGFPLKEGSSGGGDDAVSASLYAPTLDGLTPLTYGCHTKEEKLVLDTIVPRMTLLTVAIQRICNDDQYLRRDRE